MIRNISVIGAGTMGHGIALAFAGAGYNVSLYDNSVRALESSNRNIRHGLDILTESGLMSDMEATITLERIVTCDILKKAVKESDYVIEATPEILQLKKMMFSELDRICRTETILASNTSGLKLEDIIEDLPEKRKERCMICHWFNPAYIVPAVELSYFGNMPEHIFEEVRELYEKTGKETVTVLRDINGLIANRLQHGLLREAMALIEEGIAIPEDIERAAKYGPCFRLATTGILELCDMGGIDIWAATARNLWPSLNNADSSSKMLDNMTEEGRLGVKTGAGFYLYDNDAEERNRVFIKKLAAQLKLKTESGS